MLKLLRKEFGEKGRYVCRCGNEFVALRSNVSSGHTQSCGCKRKQVTRERSLTHGHKADGKRSVVYVAWVNMKQRCNNRKRPDWVNYGGRGIVYAPEWETFENFCADMGNPPKGAMLERNDNDGPYCKANCEWDLRAKQNLNKRNIVRYAWNGKSLTLGEWERETGIQRITLLKRLQRGIPIEVALTMTPWSRQ